MKAVNLIPKDNRSNRSIKTGTLGPGHAVLAVLLVAIGLVSIYVLTKNTVSDRQAKLTALNAEVAQAQQLAAGLQQYTSFQEQAQQRASTARTIIASRFDWGTALDELAQVVPQGTALMSLLGTVVPTAAVAGGSSGGGGAAGLRADIAVPAFQISGCAQSHDQVAQLMSRLRLINGVTRVTLSDSQRALGSTPSAAVPTSPVGPTGASGKVGVCPSSAPTFDMVIFFTAIPNAGAEGVLAVSGVTGASGIEPPTGTTSTVGTTATTGTTSGTTTVGGSQ